MLDGPEGGRMEEQTDRWTNRRSPHSTGLNPLSGPLPNTKSNQFFPIHPICLEGSHIAHLGLWGAPSEPPKQKWLPLKPPIFPQSLQLWVISGSLSLKSKIKLFATYLICHQESQIAHLGPWGAPSDPPKNFRYPFRKQLTSNSSIP